ncbi:uncharacterized protein LOC116417726 isoform X2 [Nasonia vitripennis]|uniref:Uncharacterized protein n=1 Tax=Nasonia vitripennis TaxID=7425 RepID=A0A7M7QKM7_NASVI|nr:uncharacterized protein LOC116417726 isoform X2 [Nasonia vitripennis]
MRTSNKVPTTELIGYIDHIIAPGKVGQKTGKTYDLFKFVLTNGSKGRVMCLIWGLELIKKYQSEIANNRILHIDLAYTKAAQMNNEKETLNVLPFEIIIQKVTVVVYRGIHLTRPDTPESTPTEVDFESIKEAIGMISISGYVKSKFALSSTRYENMTYGCGAITDGTFKLTIQIGYVPIELEKGTYVRVVGSVVNTDGMLKVTCKTSSDITPVEDHAVMPPHLLIRGTQQIIVPKRKLNED